MKYDEPIQDEIKLWIRKLHVMKLTCLIAEAIDAKIGVKEKEKSEILKAMMKEKNLKQAIERHPDQVWPYGQLGNYYIDKLRFKEAIEVTEAAIEKGLDDPMLHFTLATAYYSMGDFQSAEKTILIHLESYPNSDRGHEILGRLYYKAGMAERGIEELEKAFHLNPQNRNVIDCLGPYYLAYGQIDEALDMFKKAIELNPKSYGGYAGLARCYREKRMEREAIQMYEKALMLNIEDDTAFTEVFEVYKEVGIEESDTIKNLREQRNLARNDQDDSHPNITQYHYQKLYEILKAQRIRLIAMQYPTLDVGKLRRMFDSEDDVIIIGNQEIFSRALKKGKYEDYFIDRFAKTFGHATRRGNRMIAENLFHIIVNELELEGSF